MADRKLKHRSWAVTEGPERAPHRSMFRAMGMNDEDLSRPMIGEVFGCGSCGAQLEVANTDPLTLEPMARVEDEEEDLR